MLICARFKLIFDVRESIQARIAVFVWVLAILTSSFSSFYLQTESTGPYLSLVVVTKHDTNPGLFNTKFRLNFHSRQEAAQNVFADAQEENVITIGGCFYIFLLFYIVLIDSAIVVQSFPVTYF